MFDGLIAAGLGFLGQERANEANAEQSANQMWFQSRMRDTQYQTAVEDMRKAGLNPMLAYQQGGAGNLQGAKAQIENSMTPAVNSGVAAAVTRATVANLETQNDKIRAETKAAEADAVLKNSSAMRNMVEIPKIEQETITSTASASQLRSQEAVNTQMLTNLQAQADRLFVQNALTRAEEDMVREQIKNVPLQGDRIRADTGNVKVDTLLKQLDVPRARNVERAQGDWWMRTVSPYLNDVLRGATSGARLRSMIER